MKALVLALTVAAASAGAASAQTAATPQTSRQQERVDAILGALFGNTAGNGAAGTTAGTGGSLDTQWALGRTPLAQQRTQYETRIDADVRSGALNAAAGERAKTDYRALVDLEARYGADRFFTAQERADLNQRYNALTQVVAEGGAAGGVSGGASVADGRAEFEARVDEGVRVRRLTRVQGTQLKTQYADLARLESDYLRDGVLSVRERDDLESRLDALDAKVGDAAATPAPTPVPARPLEPSVRLEAIARALPASGLDATAQAQLRVEAEDLNRLAAAYRRLTPTAEEQAYLDRRLTDLETRARVRR